MRRYRWRVEQAEEPEASHLRAVEAENRLLREALATKQKQRRDLVVSASPSLLPSAERSGFCGSG